MYVNTTTIPLGSGQQINLSGAFTLTPTRGITEQGAVTTIYELDILGGSSAGGATNSIQWNNGGALDGFWNFNSATQTIYDGTGSSLQFAGGGQTLLSSQGSMTIQDTTSGASFGIDSSGYISISSYAGTQIVDQSWGNYINVNSDGSNEIVTTNGGNLLLRNSVYGNSISVGGTGAITIGAANGLNMVLTNYTYGNYFELYGNGGVEMRSYNYQNVNILSQSAVNVFGDYSISIQANYSGPTGGSVNIGDGTQSIGISAGVMQIGGSMSTSTQILGRFRTQIQTQTMTTGGSVTSNGSPTLMLHATGTIANYSVQFPSSPVDGQYFCVTTDQTITTFGMSFGGSFSGAPTTLTASTPANFQWSYALNKWLRV